jgi:hypothetical protein
MIAGQDRLIARLREHGRDCAHAEDLLSPGSLATFEEDLAATSKRARA